MSDPVIRSIPLDRLELSPANVRRTAAGKTAFAELKASIVAHGLLENLVVRPLGAGQDGTDRYAVIAGGRRLSALTDLVAEDVLAGDHPVPCRILEEHAHPPRRRRLAAFLAVGGAPAFGDLVEAGVRSIRLAGTLPSRRSASRAARRRLSLSWPSAIRQRPSA